MILYSNDTRIPGGATKRYSYDTLLPVRPPRPLTGFIFLNLFGLLECLVMWLISMPVIKV